MKANIDNYKKLKADYKDTLLLFHVGDFYELFDEDAKTVARVLGSRMSSSGGVAFPHQALDWHIAKLIKLGFRVAVCEQVEKRNCPDCGCSIERHNAVNLVDGEPVAHCGDCGCCWRTKGTKFVELVREKIKCETAPTAT